MRAIVTLMIMASGLAAVEHTTDPLPQVLQAVRAGQAVLLDVRETKEWNAGHLADAKHLPLSRLQAGIPAAELAPFFPAGKTVYLHCASGVRCLGAAELLQTQGQTTRPLAAGYKALLKAGFTAAP